LEDTGHLADCPDLVADNLLACGNGSTWWQKQVPSHTWTTWENANRTAFISNQSDWKFMH